MARINNLEEETKRMARRDVLNDIRRFGTETIAPPIGSPPETVASPGYRLETPFETIAGEYRATRRPIIERIKQTFTKAGEYLTGKREPSPAPEIPATEAPAYAPSPHTETVEKREIPPVTPLVTEERPWIREELPGGRIRYTLADRTGWMEVEPETRITRRGDVLAREGLLRSIAEQEAERRQEILGRMRAEEEAALRQRRELAEPTEPVSFDQREYERRLRELGGGFIEAVPMRERRKLFEQMMKEVQEENRRRAQLRAEIPRYEVERLKAEAGRLKELRELEKQRFNQAMEAAKLTPTLEKLYAETSKLNIEAKKHVYEIAEMMQRMSEEDKKDTMKRFEAVMKSIENIIDPTAREIARQKAVAEQKAESEWVILRRYLINKYGYTEAQIPKFPIIGMQYTIPDPYAPIRPGEVPPLTKKVWSEVGWVTPEEWLEGKGSIEPIPIPKRKK